VFVDSYSDVYSLSTVFSKRRVSSNDPRLIVYITDNLILRIPGNRLNSNGIVTIIIIIIIIQIIIRVAENDTMMPTPTSVTLHYIDQRLAKCPDQCIETDKEEAAVDDAGDGEQEAELKLSSGSRTRSAHVPRGERLLPT